MRQRIRRALQRLFSLFQQLGRTTVPPDLGDAETDVRVWSGEETPAFPVDAYLAGIRSCGGSYAEWGHVCVGSRAITAAWLRERTGVAVKAGPDSTSVVHARPRQGA